MKRSYSTLRNIALCLTAIILSLSTTGNLSAEAGLTSVPVLQLPASPSASALLGGGTAMGKNIWSTSQNPAVAGLQDYTEAAFAYEILPFGFSSQNIMWVKPTGGGSFGFELKYLGTPPIEVYDDNFNKSVTSATDIVFGAMYAINFSDVSMGIKGNYIESHLADFTARTVSMDFGTIIYFDVPAMLYPTRNQNLGLSFGMRNLSPGIKYAEVTTPLPFMYYGGLFYNIVNFPWMETNLEFFGERYHEQYWSVGPGLEFQFGRYGAVRGSLISVTNDGSKKSSLSYAAGASLFLSLKGYIYDLSYSIRPGGELGIYHQFGLRVQFGGGEEWPLGSDRWFSSSGKKRVVKEPTFTEPEDSSLPDEDRMVLVQLRRSIYRFQKKKGRYPRDLNELLLFLNQYHIYEIPNPKKGKYRYNKRTGKLFIRE